MHLGISRTALPAPHDSRATHTRLLFPPLALYLVPPPPHFPSPIRSALSLLRRLDQHAHAALGRARGSSVGRVEERHGSGCGCIDLARDRHAELRLVCVQQRSAETELRP